MADDYCCCFTSGPDHSTPFVNEYHDVLDPEPPNASDRLLYAHETYANPSPVLIMMHRASLDNSRLETQPVNPFACNEPLRLFTLTGGRTPLTGLHDHDQQSHAYYDKRPHPSPFGHPECFISYCYSVSSIEALQQSLRTVWSSVYPTPIPPVIIRSRDLIGPFSLGRRLDGFAFVVPTQDSIWATFCQRGVDLDFRPMDPSLTVETCFCSKGDAFYYPQHIVASKFAVNVFLELADSATSADPLCEYLGAYVLQAMDGMSISRAVWADVDPKVQQAVYDRAPGCFRVYNPPSLGWPRLPYVRFCYYKWDRNIIGLADEGPDRTIPTANQGIPRPEPENERVGLGGWSDDSGSDIDVEQYWSTAAPSAGAHSPKQKNLSFIHYWPCT